MNFIYGILCHKVTNPLIYSVKKISSLSNTIVLIHVDRKSDIELFYHEFLNLKNVHIIKERCEVSWGGFSQIQSTLNLLKQAQDYEYKYFSLLSGDDIPLQSIEKFQEFLKKNPYEYIDLEASPDHNLINRIQYKYSPSFFQKNRTQTQKINCKINRLLFKLGLKKQDISSIPPLYKGSQWFTLSHEAITYIIDYILYNPEYVNVFKNSLCGDELFFHTILFNSSFRESIKTTGIQSQSYLRFIDWESGPDYPKTLIEIDFPRLQKSLLFFARKIDTNISLEVLEAYFGKI